VAVIFSADELCVAAEQVLRADLPKVIGHHAAAARIGSGYGEIAEWQQLPTIEALSTARFPAIAITSAGLVTPPATDAGRQLRATWRIVVGVYDRGRDHADTQARIRDWCALIRTSLLRHRSLGGVAESVTWTGEEFALLPNRNQARTIAAGAVAFDVTARLLSVADDDASGAPQVESLVLDRVQNYRQSVRFA
jgi:hypothetical protein